MAELRERKPAPKQAQAPLRDEHEKSKSKPYEEPDLQPNVFVMIGMIAAFFAALGGLVYYKIDNREHGPFANWVNTNYPIIDRALNRQIGTSKPYFGASAQSTADVVLKLTEEELKAYDGTDPEKPIYLGINGIIFDVSASPAFYGPGGHYNHFVGQDATRAWVTECWDEPEQFTWRMDDVEVMFKPKWLDEQLENVGRGIYEDGLEDIGGMPEGMVTEMAKKAMERFGTVTDKEKAKRRKQDKEVALAKTKETLDHWVKFFSDNPKYKQVGEVIRDDSRPAPPKPCAAAMKKRPMNGGKLDAMTGNIGGNMFGAGGAAAGGPVGGPPSDAKAKGEMPESVKKMLADKAKDAKKKAEGVAGDVKEKAKGVAEDVKETAEDVKEKVGLGEEDHDEL
ncbi:uncharacterized protein RCC_01134 [Ramularia collo-cygni]|uniref:Cytochrome b5 heme-binding domain-containing protein n=1 Tax=Ramularia collo-cygni TaxID=112498 RepID=A0A2D3URW3_9PEZI|nr:uncharacterized protein RCC_01134 [Ramularia collo-cygni]CZT15270.1 uncharacterized protein RCC_01134 [Ramularia collo-cygni]